MAKNGKDYFGLNYALSIIIAIIMPVSYICGVIVRFQEGKIVAGLLRLILGWNIIWIADIICIVMHRRIFRLLNV